MSARRRDPARLLAASLGYVARSGLKLDWLQKKHALIPRGGAVLDLGCSPGAWLQAASMAAGPAGCVIGVDITPVPVPQRLVRARVSTVVADATTITPAELKKLAALPFTHFFDAVLSDMCGATTGVAHVDGERSAALVRAAARLALGGGDDDDDKTSPPGLLRLGGCFAAKALESEATRGVEAELRPHFRKLVRARPPATRAASREIYLVGLGRK